MEDFKVKNFERCHNVEKFPYFSTLSKCELIQLQGRLYEKLGLRKESQLIELVNKITDIGFIIDSENADYDEFKLFDIFKKINIVPKENVYINWYRFDVVDKIKFKDFCKYFNDIWYPSSDDIDVFDDTLEWIVSIRHDGAILLALLK